jgi:hypothetical protein
MPPTNLQPSSCIFFVMAAQAAIHVPFHGRDD